MLKNMLKFEKMTLKREKTMFRINQERLIRHINDRWQTKACPYCGQNDWNIGDSIVSTISIGNNKEMQIGGRFQPLVTITCNHCGNTVFVNGLIAGAIDSDTEE